MRRLLITNSRRMKQETHSSPRSVWCYETFLQLTFPRDKPKCTYALSSYTLTGTQIMHDAFMVKAGLFTLIKTSLIHCSCLLNLMNTATVQTIIKLMSKTYQRQVDCQEYSARARQVTQERYM